jgi:cytochrome bd-type quinol oxidase subunit 2
MSEFAIDLTIAWAGIIVLAVVMYVLLDGFDLASASCSRSRRATAIAI